jgi:hypothetical protein
LKNFITIKHFILGMHFCVPLNNEYPQTLLLFLLFHPFSLN